MIAAQIAFGIIATCMLASGFLAVTTRNLVHSVLWLAVSLVATAALYATLDAPFLAAMQVMLYTGGVITLMLFGVMLTDHRHQVGVVNASGPRLPGVLAAVALFGLLISAIVRTGLPQTPIAFDSSTAHLGALLFSDHLLAFEALSVLLLAAMLGAIVLARRHDA